MSNKNNTNTNLGSNSLTYNRGINNTAIGASTLTYNTIAGNNTSLGAYSLAKNTTGINNVAIGTNSQLTNVTGSNNVAVGPATLFNNTSDVNTAIGANSLQNNTTGFSNTALGANSLQTNTTGSSNTALGFRSGFKSGLYDLSGNNNTFLGAHTDVSNNGICNSTAIGFNAIIDASNQIMIGTTSETVKIPGILLLTSENPTSDNQAATKSYVNSIASGIHPTTSCSCATTENIVLSSDPSGTLIDGYTVQIGNRVLLKNQDPIYPSGNIFNGIYDTSNNVWSRAADCSGNDVGNQTSYIQFGNTNSYTTFIQNNQGAIAGLDPLSYSVFSKSTYTIGPGLEINSLSQIQIMPELKNILTFVGIGGAVDSNYALDVSGNIHGSGEINSLTIGRGGGNISSNTAIGYQALLNNKSSSYGGGSNNTSIGYQSLYSNNPNNNNYGVATNNTSNGYKSLYSNTTGSYNTANGASALYNNTTSSSNTANGYQALYSNTTGDLNTSNGYKAGLQLNYGSNNTFLGAYADVSNNTITYNNSTAVGYGAIIDASNQIVLGTSSETVKIPGKLTGSKDATINGLTIGLGNNNVATNTANGYQALYSNSTGSTNTANGYQALYSNTTGFSNTANGCQSLYSNITGINNTANGFQSLYYNTTGLYNMANGYNALKSNTTSNYNTAIGNLALFSNTISGTTDASGSLVYNGDNTAIGHGALYYTDGSFNTSETFEGGHVPNQFSGAWNTAVGLNALHFNTTGSNNTAIGLQAGCVYDASFSLFPNGGGPMDCSCCTFLGAETGTTSASSFYKSTAVGYGAQITASNRIVLGTSSERVIIPGQLIIGTDSLQIKLQIDASNNTFFQYGVATDPSSNSGYLYFGGINAGAGPIYFDPSGNIHATNVSVSSDYRIKDNVKLLDSSFNIDNLKPVTYLNKLSLKQDIGLIAHELQEHYPYLVTGIKDGPQNQSVNYIGLIPVLIKEIQDLKNDNKTLNKKIDLIEKLLASSILKT
jgi:hypothetical protein